jgi:isoleucyl-tRNA synthetase
MEKEGGSDLWFSKTADELLPAGTTCLKCKGTRFQQERDILDVWFESGVSHAAVLDRREGLACPADLYLEGSDQHRGWFHSSLLASLETHGRAPYKAVLTHGFTVDGSGKKMSKSSGNVVAPQEVINQHGAEVLRLWVAATDFREDIRISQEILTQLVEAYRKIRNTCRFLLSNLEDFNPSDGPVREEDLLEIDRWARHRLQLLNEKVQRAYNEAEFHLIFHALNNFCAVDLSAFYLDILKDRLYASAAKSPERRAAQSVLLETLTTLVRLMAPILSFTAEEIWSYIPNNLKSTPSVHLTEFPPIKQTEGFRAEPWTQLIQIREGIARVLEGMRKEKKIGNSLEARVELRAGPALFHLLDGHRAFLPSLFIVSQVDLSRSDSLPPNEFEAEAYSARGTKCERCWIYREDVGVDASHPTLCGRCVEAVIADRTDRQ